MERIWIPAGLAASSLGNFLLGLLVANLAANKDEFGSYAIAFAFYTIALSFFRPIICDPLFNKDIFKKSNGQEFIYDAIVLSFLFTVPGTILYFLIPQFHSLPMLILNSGFPILLLHDAIRYKLLTFKLNKITSLLDISWTTIFLLIFLCLDLINLKNSNAILLAWILPTLLTSTVGTIIVLRQEQGNWKYSWLYTTKKIWLKNLQEFILGAGTIQIILLVSFSWFDSSNAANYRLSIMLLFPVLLLNTSQTLEFFNFGKLNVREYGLSQNFKIFSKINSKLFFGIYIYLFFILLFHRAILEQLTSFELNFDVVTFALTASSVLIAILQIDFLAFLKKSNHYSELILLRRKILPWLLFASLFFGAIYSFNGVLFALNFGGIIFLFQVRKATHVLVSSQSLLVVAEENSGGLFTTAKFHFENSLNLGVNVYFVLPGSTNNSEIKFERNISNIQRIHFLKFPKSIWNLRETVVFMQHFRKLWKSLDRPKIFTHGIRSGFLVSICCFNRPHVLIHRCLDENISLLSKTLLKIPKLFFKTILSVAPHNEAFPEVTFFPILSPLLNHSGVSSLFVKSNTEEVLRILWIGRLDYPKNPEILLLALQDLDRARYSCKMIGQGPKELYCEKMVNEFNLNVDFMHHGNSLDEFANADVIVLISQFEGVPFVLQEALATGTAVICSNLPGNQFLGSDAFDYANTPNEISFFLKLMLNTRYLNRKTESIKKQWLNVYPKLNPISELNHYL